jgi:hypothetical protein
MVTGVLPALASYTATKSLYAGTPDQSIPLALLIPTHTADPHSDNLPMAPVKKGNAGIDPSGATTFTITETAGSVPLSAIELPSDPVDKVAGYYQFYHRLDRWAIAPFYRGMML